MSQTTLEKSTEESFSDDNVGGSPRAALPSSPTKDQPVSLTEAEGDSRAISPASSPFAPSSAPLSAENGLGRCSLTTQDSGVDETLDETIEEERARASVAGAKRKLCGDVTEKEEADYAGWFIEEKANEVFALDLAPTCSEPQALPIRPVVGSTADTAVNSVTVESSYPEHRESRLRRRRRRSRVFPPPSSSSGRDVESPKSATKHSSSDGDTKASVISAVEPGPCTSRTIAEKQRKAEALAAERSRERLVNFAAAEAAAEAARERARQQREARSQELKRREEERRRNADERRKALEMARQGRNVSTTGRDASTVTNPGLSKSLRVSSVHGRGAPTSLPRGFASELDPSDPRYCPYGFGSSCRREVCLTTSQIVKTHNDQNRRNILTTSFTADVKRKFHVPDKRMTTSATINYNRLIGGLDTGRVLAKHQLNKTTAVQPQSATAASSLKAVNSRSHLRKLAEIRSMRIPPSLMKSAELSSQEKNNHRTFETTSSLSTKTRGLPTFARQKPTYAVNNPKPTRMLVQTRVPAKHNDVRMLTAVSLGKSQPRKPTQIAPHPQNPPAKLPVKVCADASLASCMALRDADEGSLQITTTEVAQKYITSVRGGTEPSDEEVAEYRARMKEQRKLALERREEEEAAAAAAAAKDADRRVEQEAMNLIIREIAEVTVGEAIDQAIAELKAEAIQAAVMDEQTEQVQQHNSQNSSYSPSQLPQKAAFRLETVMQGMSTVPPAGAAITVSPVPTEGNPTVVLRGTNLLNRSFSANDLQPASENDKNLIEAAVATSKERLNKGLQQMAMSVGEKWDENSKTLALRTLSNVTAEASEREERKRRLQQVMLRIRTPHGSSVSLATDESEATSPGPNHFFADSDGAIKVEDHPGDLPLTPSAHRTAIQFKPNAILSVLESGRLPKNSRAAALLREKVVSPTIINAPKNFDGNIPSSVAKMTDYSQDGGPVDLTSDEDVEDERLSTPIQGLSAPTTDLVTQAQPTTALAAAGEEVDEDKVNAESITKEETAGGGVPPTGVQFGLDEEQDIPLSLSTLRPEHTAVLRHSILVRDPQSKLSQADLEVFNAIGDASPQPAE